MALLEVENLSVTFPSRGDVLRAVDGVSMTVDTGEVLGIVGESGSGKSVGMLAVMGLVPFSGCVTAAGGRGATHPTSPPKPLSGPRNAPSPNIPPRSPGE